MSYSLRFEFKDCCAIAAFAALCFMPTQMKGQYPGSTPSMISANIAGATPTNYDPAASSPVTEVNAITTNSVSFTLVVRAQLIRRVEAER